MPHPFCNEGNGKQAMMTSPRWRAEVGKIRICLPTFRAFARPGVEAGFYGRWRGPRSGRVYEIVTRTPLKDYPQKEPGVYIDPHPETHHWIGDGRLCYRRDGHHWNPANDTFAEVLAIAVKYINEFDR